MSNNQQNNNGNNNNNKNSNASVDRIFMALAGLDDGSLYTSKFELWQDMGHPLYRQNSPDGALYRHKVDNKAVRTQKVTPFGDDPEKKNVYRCIETVRSDDGLFPDERAEARKQQPDENGVTITKQGDTTSVSMRFDSPLATRIPKLPTKKD